MPVAPLDETHRGPHGGPLTPNTPGIKPTPWADDQFPGRHPIRTLVSRSTQLPGTTPTPSQTADLLGMPPTPEACDPLPRNAPTLLVCRGVSSTGAPWAPEAQNINRDAVRHLPGALMPMDAVVTANSAHECAHPPVEPLPSLTHCFQQSLTHCFHLLCRTIQALIMIHN